MSDRQIRVCIVDDHPIVAEGLRQIFRGTDDILCIGTATNARELETILEVEPANVLVLDVRLGDTDGIELCAKLRRQYPDMRVLLLTSFGDGALVRRGLSAGASGFALKSISLDLLPAAIREVSFGVAFVSSGILTESLFRSKVRSSDEPLLTDREREIVKMVSDGMSNKEIARALGLSPHTIKLHVSKLLTRFCYRSRSQLALAVNLF